MIIVMKSEATEKQIKYVVNRLKKLGLKAHISRGVERTIIGAIGDERIIHTDQFAAIPGIEKIMPVLKPYKLASREFHPDDSIIKVNNVRIGGKKLVTMAGPCAVESEKQIMTAAKAVQKAGAQIFRGGAYKPRTSPYSFQGLGKKGLKILSKVKKVTDLSIVTEVMDTADINLVGKYADILQIGARNMQNYNLLKAVGKTDKPVLLKRGMSATVVDLLMSAEYILSKGNSKVILCERGIRTFCSYTRNTLDLNVVPYIKKVSHLPIIVDPSHATGRSELIKPIAMAAIAAGADGLIIEVHPHPEEALVDGDQSLGLNDFSQMMHKLVRVARVVGKEI